MEKQKLPNSTTTITLGILSIITTCCCLGFLNIIFGIIALVLAKKDMQLYLENPKLYINDYHNIKIGKVLAIIGITLGVLHLLSIIYEIINGSFDVYSSSFFHGDAIDNFYDGNDND